MSRLLLVGDERMQGHDPGPGHPESPGRLAAILKDLEGSPLRGASRARAQSAPTEALIRVHRQDYVDLVLGSAGESCQFDADTVSSPRSVEASLLASGAAMQAVDAVCQGQAAKAFALVRPPGHHAERAAAMGFCLFNNVAVAAAHAMHEHGLERVLIVDWDVHHGNGTQHMFGARSDVLFFSSHQAPFYPGTGALHERGRGEGLNRTLNLPLSAGVGDGDLAYAFRELLRPAADEFRPELVLVSAGFDGHRDDPLAGFDLTDGGFAHLCAVVQDIAREHADGRMALVLEGGYDLGALARSVRACCEVMLGASAPTPGPPGVGRAQVDRAVSAAAR